MNMGRDEAERLGAMALFGEKYGDWVRVVEVEDVSRELCGGTHVANTAEVGIFTIVSEGSSAANVRRVEALTGPAAIDHFRERSDALREAGAALGSPRDPVSAARRAAERLAELEREAARSGSEGAAQAASELAERSVDDRRDQGPGRARRGRRPARAARPRRPLKASLGDAAVVLGGAHDGRVALVASFTESAVERGLSAADVVREAAAVVGGGGGGRANVAQAGGRDESRLDEALETARGAIESRVSPSSRRPDAHPRPRPRTRALRRRDLGPDGDDRAPARGRSSPPIRRPSRGSRRARGGSPGRRAPGRVVRRIGGPGRGGTRSSATRWRRWWRYLWRPTTNGSRP